jgi:hypothetical protein
MAYRYRYSGEIPKLEQLRRDCCWIWLNCAAPGCRHRAPIAFTPYIIRWGADASSDMLRRCARCSVCGKKGATLTHASSGRRSALTGHSWQLFPADEMSKAQK